MIQSVLVGVDFSAASRQALDKGSAWAARLGVPVVALHVLQPPAPMLPEAQIALPDPTWLQEMEQQARAQLAAWVKEIPNAESRVAWGSPAKSSSPPVTRTLSSSSPKSATRPWPACSSAAPPPASCATRPAMCSWCGRLIERMKKLHHEDAKTTKATKDFLAFRAIPGRIRRLQTPFEVSQLTPRRPKQEHRGH